MRAMPRRMMILDPRCEFGVLAASPSADNAFEELGDGLQGPATRAVRAALQPLKERISELGEEASIAQCERLVKWAESRPAYEALCTSRVRDGRRVVKSSVLYLKSIDRARTLIVRLGFGEDVQALVFEVETGNWAALHDLLSLVSLGASREAVRRAAVKAKAEELVNGLLEAGWLGERDDDRVPKAAHGAGIWFVGHNMALVASKTTRVVVDPWFRPWRDADPADYKPIRPCDLGPVDAIAITHTHGDHFHLGSLLAFPRDTPVLVPAIERDSILASDLSRILREIGFTDVRPMEWWQTAKIGDVTVGAMPFYGEQPSSIAVIDPALRNVGNTWYVRTPAFAAAFLADTGRDALGSMNDVALGARRRWGAPDFVFGGMRGFETAPLLLPFTTIDAMWVNVPLEVMPVRQRLMNDATDLVIASELFGARYVLPYADGGAPWFWREGMGPTYAMFESYPGEREATGRHEEDPFAAPFPENVFAASERRAGRTRAVEPLVLRPGDLVRWTKGAPAIGRIEGFGWPWSDTPLEDVAPRPAPRRRGAHR